MKWVTATKVASGRRRWLSADPIGESGGLNLYGYVGNDPVNSWDPLGLCDDEDVEKKRDKAAIDAARAIRKDPRSRNMEFGSTLYSRDGKFSQTRPTTQGRQNRIRYDPNPNKTNYEGVVHNHRNGEPFSGYDYGDDKGQSKRTGKPGYMTNNYGAGRLFKYCPTEDKEQIYNMRTEEFDDVSDVHKDPNWMSNPDYHFR